jgi:hypothetical protein
LDAQKREVPLARQRSVGGYAQADVEDRGAHMAGGPRLDPSSIRLAPGVADPPDAFISRGVVTVHCAWAAQLLTLGLRDLAAPLAPEPAPAAEPPAADPSLSASDYGDELAADAISVGCGSDGLDVIAVGGRKPEEGDGVCATATWPGTG